MSGRIKVEVVVYIDGKKFGGYAENLSGIGREVRRDDSTPRELIYLAADRALDALIEGLRAVEDA